jgi:hypothetical protein
MMALMRFPKTIRTLERFCGAHYVRSQRLVSLFPLRQPHLCRRSAGHYRQIAGNTKGNDAVR